MNRFLCFVVSIFFISLKLVAQERPPIEIFSPKTNGAENQNWSISQSKDENIYVANNKGLLEFNGAFWKLYPSPNETIMRSVKVIDNLIYTGCYREFGYWERNELGSLNYTSLSQKLNIKFLDDEEVWNIIEIDEWILFQTLKRIYIYNKNNESFEFISSDTSIYKIFKVDGSIYFQKTKDGIYKIVNGIPVLLTNDKVIKDNLLVNIFALNDSLLIETEDDGFYLFDKKTLKKWDIPAKDIISNVSVYRSIQLKDGSFILGTISNGILHILPNGELDYQINNYTGLSNNTVQSIFEDAESNIWLGLNNGINCINTNSPFKIYNEENGKLGTVYTSYIFNNNLYLGTNQGLFYKSLTSDSDFKFINGTQGQVWSLVEYDNTLFCGHNTGTFIVKNNNAELISDIQGTWNIIPVKSHENLLLQGNYDGLYVLEKKNNIWKLRNKIEGFDISSKFFEMLDLNTVLLSHEYKGVFKIKIDGDITKVTNVVKDTSVDKGLTSSLISYNNDIVYAYKKGIFKYNISSQSFVKDSLLSKLFTPENYTSGKLVYEKHTKNLWVFSSNNLSYISPGKLSNKPRINTIPLSEFLPRGLTGYENISYLNNQKFLIGTASGYIVLDLDKIHEKAYQVKINSITVSDLDSNLKPVNLFEDGEFINKDNNIDFSFNVSKYDKYLDIEYQYQLIGIDEHWSHWSKAPTISFKYLPFGKYVFNVKARVGNTISKNIATYTFEIKRPWFISNVMITVYIILLWLFSLIIHNIYKRYYKKQREKLLYKTQQELELKELENQKQLMQFNNDKLRQDIESKNRELGISTMSLIKKNEFLNYIKNELKTAHDFKNVNHVVKIIDKNLNNTDDWNLFAEAFNNADKDFLKKIKNDHPTLTSNDLRLCAYLRLNLSSKEIAPLLNISPRSVEVKRYRLRKKMGLSHESSLIDYILEI
jgi:AraC family transcriptional regulator, chitin signaling transcriptional activator